MRRQIVVAGSGKMARDVGLFFLGRGHDVAWLSRDKGRLEELRRWVERKARRLSKLSPDMTLGDASFLLVGQAEIPRAQILVECINEAAEDKRELLRELDALIPADAVRVTNSSSIFPDALHSQCAGLHFFYPVELTGFVEAVFPEGYPQASRARLLALLEDTRLECIEEEGEEGAFAVNRLLLPLQAEAVRLVRLGVDPIVVDKASTSEVIPVGQLALMDTIGLDVVGPAVRNFRGRMDQEMSAAYTELDETLTELLALGRLGRKNKKGFFKGDPLPWTVSDCDVNPRPGLFRCLFVSTCYHALESGQLTSKELALALDALFGWDQPLERGIGNMSRAEAVELLDRAYDQTGRAYFVPARAFLGSRGL